MGVEKKRSPGSAAKRGTLEEFLTPVEGNPEKDWRSFLLWTFRNKDLTARVGIVDWALDHDADPTRVDSGEKINALHVMFEEREHDFVGEARLLQRFLDRGADINLKAPKWNALIQMIIDKMIAPDVKIAPLYDVLFSYLGINRDVIVGKAFGELMLLCRSVELSAKQRPELYRRMYNYLGNGPSSRPMLD